MPMGKLCLTFVVCLAASAQTGSLSGVVRNVDGTGLANATLSDGHTTVESNADGTFTFSGIGPGEVTLTVTGGDGNSIHFSKSFTLLAGQFINGVELVVPSWGSISGRVTDSAGSPLRGVPLQLLGREYRGGVLQYVPRGAAVTDERGVYQFAQAAPAMSYVVAAVPRIRFSATLPPPQAKRPLVLPITYYPTATDIDGALPIVLRSAEQLGGIDIRLVASTTYCMGGTIQLGDTPGAAPYDVFQEDSQGLLIRSIYTASSDAAGKFLICGVPPGAYRILAGPKSAAGGYHSASARVSLRDGDDRELRLAVQTVPQVKFSWDWAGTPPSPPVTLPVAASLELQQPGQSASFQISGGPRSAPLLDYIVNPTGLPLGYYVKDETIGGIHALRRPILPWTSVQTGAEIHFVIGNDGATVGGNVTDSNGNPVVETKVLILPTDAGTPEELSVAMMVLAPDRNGQFISSTVAPGKYQVLATASPVVLTPECMAKILRARPGAQEVDVGPSGTTSVKLNPVRLE
jgi:hypothetical protein